jgi:2-aminoadipate transaminase
MFLWAEGPEGLDAAEFYERCIACNVAFVPGKYFYTEPGAGLATMRLNYTMIDEPAIDAAVRTVAEVYTEQMSVA